MLRGILIAFVLTASALGAQSVEGRVVDSSNGVDIPGVAVNLVQDGEVAYKAVTDLQGHFRIEPVKAGAYTANYTARGFVPLPSFFLDEYFELSGCRHCFLAPRGGQQFQVTAAGDPVRLEIKMPPLGRISGRLFDPEGKPVPNAAIQLHWGQNWLCKTPTCTGFTRQVKTGANGEYNATDLDLPGAWLVSAVAPLSGKPLAGAPTFYPGVTDPQLAFRVIVGFGGEISNLDFKLAAVPVHRVRGVVLDPAGNPVPDATVTLGSLTQNTRGDGAFEFDTVAEGEWRISAKVDRLRASRELALRDHDLENVQLRLSAPFAIQGKIVMEVPEGGHAPPAPEVRLALNHPEDVFPAGKPDAKGHFTIQNVYPGEYQILPAPPPPLYYLDAIRIGGRDALESDVPISPEAQPLIVAYKLGGGTVRGVVEKCAGGVVRLLPQDKAMWRPGFILFAPCDSNDRYALAAVRPGVYYALAIAGDSPTAWHSAAWDDDRLANNASPITVRPGENTSADLRAIH